MQAVVPWARLEELIAPHYTRPRKGRPQFPPGVMLRIYFLQQWYGLSDPGAEEALYDMHSMRDFAGLDLAHDPIPDETTILNFRHLLEKHNLTGALFVPKPQEVDRQHDKRGKERQKQRAERQSVDIPAQQLVVERHQHQPRNHRDYDPARPSPRAAVRPATTAEGSEGRSGTIATSFNAPQGSKAAPSGNAPRLDRRHLWSQILSWLSPHQIGSVPWPRMLR